MASHASNLKGGLACIGWRNCLRITLYIGKEVAMVAGKFFFSRFDLFFSRVVARRAQRPKWFKPGNNP